MKTAIKENQRLAAALATAAAAAAAAAQQCRSPLAELLWEQQHKQHTAGRAQQLDIDQVRRVIFPGLPAGTSGHASTNACSSCHLLERCLRCLLAWLLCCRWIPTSWPGCRLSCSQLLDKRGALRQVCRAQLRWHMSVGTVALAACSGALLVPTKSLQVWLLCMRTGSLHGGRSSTNLGADRALCTTLL